VEVLCGVAHVQRCRVHEAFGRKPGIGLGARAHRVVAHVFHTPGDHHVVSAKADTAGGGCHGGHGAGAHPVNGKAGNSPGKSGQEGRGPAQGQALVTGLGGGSDGNFVNPFGRQRGVPAQQFAEAFHYQVVGPGSGIDAFFSRPAKGGTEAVDKNDVPDTARGCSAVFSTGAGLAHV